LKTLIVIGGATASGKTAVAIETALYFNTCILSADSRQCYRELNIGVAKPDIGQLKAVQHFFINSHSVHEEVSAGVYGRYGLEKLALIFEQSDFAVCAGGTGLYIKALCEGLDVMPSIDKSIDQYINEQYLLHGLGWLQQQVQQHDPLFAPSAEFHNPNRLLRALVFKLSTGESILQFRTNQKQTRNFDIRYFALDAERTKLYQRIDQRVDEMVAQGLVAEAAQLHPLRHLKPLQTVGYTELFDYFEGKLDLSLAIGKIKQHSRNYAKRQITWFKHQSDYIFVPPTCENIIQALGY